MSAIITEKFRLHNAEQFYESFSESSKNAYYLMVGKSTPFTAGTSGGTDDSPPTPADDVTSEFYVWDQTIASKNIASTDITYALPRRDWTNSTVYDMYEDNISSDNTTTSGATNLYDSTFFFRTSDNRVYKVLDNNAGAAYSGAEPSSESSSAFELGGYTLRYIYTMSASEQTKFLTADFMPVSTDATISAAAVDGSVESLIVTAGSGYTNGTYYAPILGDGSNGVVSIVVSGGAIASFGLTAGTDTSINTAGSGYTYATVSLTTRIYTTAAAATTNDNSTSLANSTGTIGGGSSGVVTVVISPKGGHGYNAVEELGGHYVMMRATLTGAENDDIHATNDFRNIAVVTDPTTYGTSTVASSATYRQTFATKMTSTSGTFTVDEEITQATSGARGRVVEHDSSNAILYYQQERYQEYGTTNSSTTVDGDGYTFGVGANAAFATGYVITGTSSSAVGTPDSTADTAVTLAGGNTVTFTNGLANPELQPDSGNIIYNEYRKPISRATDQTEDIKIIVEF